MAKEGLLQELDKSKLNNFSNLDTSFTNTKVDPENKYSIPYMWGSTGLAINGDAIDPATVNSWNDLWRPEYKGQVMLTNDVREVFGMSLPHWAILATVPTLMRSKKRMRNSRL